MYPLLAYRVAVIVGAMYESSPAPSLLPQHPLGPPVGLEEGRAQTGGPSTRSLVATSEGVHESQVVLARDLGEIFGRLCRWALDEGSRVALFEPSRPELVDGILAVGARYVDPGRGSDWHLQEEALDRALEDGDLRMVVLGRPCPVAGTLPSMSVIRRCLSAGLLVVVDESWLPFSGAEDEDLTPLLAEPEGGRLALIRCLDSAWGLEEDRVGYLLAGDEISANLRSLSDDASVSDPVDGTLRWMMQEPSTRLEHARALREARDQVLSALMEIPGLNPLPNRGPWIAFCCPGRSGAELATGLGSQGIQAHHSEHWSWRDAVVLAVPRPEQRRGLIGAVRKILSAA